jgi:hypothetical protein
VKHLESVRFAKSPASVFIQYEDTQGEEERTRILRQLEYSGDEPAKSVHVDDQSTPRMTPVNHKMSSMALKEDVPISVEPKQYKFLFSGIPGKQKTSCKRIIEKVGLSLFHIHFNLLARGCIA